MVTVTLRMAAKERCAPHTINRLLTAVRGDATVADRFWPRLVKDRTINGGKRIGAKIDPENLEFLRRLKKLIRSKFELFVSYSMLVCVLAEMYRKPAERQIMSLNVKGYKAMSRDFADRLKGIARQVRNVLPDILLLQEFKAGEDNVFRDLLLKELGQFYNPVFSAAYNAREDFNNCICIMMVGKHIAHIRATRLKHEAAGFKLRYNLVQTDDYVILNAWAPQVYNVQQDRLDMADSMWKELLDMAQYYSDKMKKFCLAGDLNAFMGGSQEDKIIRLNAMLRDTKIMEEMSRPTGPVNVLDHAFVNRFADQSDMVRTTILDPSVKQMELSDHDALLMRITEVS